MGLELYPFQKEGVAFLKSHKSVLLADDPGVGKTAQTCVALEHRSPVLVVCPNAVKWFWAKELVRWGGYSVEEILVYEQGDNRVEGLFEWGGVKVWILHWESLRYNETALRQKFWSVIIADEAHRMKGRNTQQSKVIRALKAATKYALTGTPIINRDDEVWSLLNFLFPQQYRGYWKFMNDWMTYEKNIWGGLDYVRFKDVKAFKRELAQFMIRRKKEDVLPQLPPKVYTHLDIELGPEQRRVYEEMKEKFLAEIKDDEVITASTALVKLIRLRQIACGLFLCSSGETSTKLDAALELIEDCNKPVVVFSNFVGMVEKLKEKLGDRCRIITGEVSTPVREENIKAFQAGEYQVIALTTQTGGTGITLTRADMVLFLDLPWSPAIKLQAEDRIHRIGQEATSVTITSLIVKDTVEEKMEQLLRYKSALMERLTGKELKELF
jgi:SNF2 family DNA or RNA helicase